MYKSGGAAVTAVVCGRCAARGLGIRFGDSMSWSSVSGHGATRPAQLGKVMESHDYVD
jgi:hypothetical protein